MIREAWFRILCAALAYAAVLTAIHAAIFWGV